MRKRIVAPAAALAVGLCAHDAPAALTFDFSRSPATTQEDFDTILPKFQEAGARWSSVFGDDITVNLQIGWVALAQGIGSTNVQATNASYQDFATYLAADARTTTDATAMAHLPTGGAFSILTRNQPNTTVVETSTTPTVRNTTMVLPSAQAKAIGYLSGASPGVDAFLTFNKTYDFDYDPSDGVTAGFVDFVGIVTHEIGHALGFSSGVDTIDRFTGNGPAAGTPTDLSAMTIYNPLDMFRYSATSGLDVLDGVPGTEAYFSIDGGATAIAELSRGFFNGNNAQASHWLDNLGLGLLDPTANRGELLAISDNDLTAFDAIGYDLVPEPTGVAVLLVPAAAGVLARRRRAAGARA
jgi:hypothetical protein